MTVSPDSQVFTPEARRRPPSETCIFCGRQLEEIGGKRLVAQSLRGIRLVYKNSIGGIKDRIHQSIKLYEDSEIYVEVWGETEKWTESSINRARSEILNCKMPWFCQICGKRKCEHCGSPVNFPMGSDILHDDNSILHVGIFPVDPGCINPDCGKYKKGSI